MTSIVSAVRAAHSLASSIFESSALEPGKLLPTVDVKEDDPAVAGPLILTGKNVLVGVPGAFTTPCNGHIPPYIERFPEFKAKGIDNVYVLAVNDAFVMKAWKEHLAPYGTQVRFISDDKGTFVTELGLVFDGSALLGGVRSKRFAIVADDGKIVSAVVETFPSDVTVTSAEAVLKSL